MGCFDPGAELCGSPSGLTPALPLTAVVGVVSLGPALSQGSKCSVIDGDTLKLGDESIRISNIDTPERGGLAECDAERFLAAIASQFAEEIIASGEAEIEREPNLDRYGRTLARVTIDGGDLWRLKIDRGVAVRGPFPSSY